MQFGQRVALIEMLEKHFGQSLVVGSAGGASTSARFILFMLLMSKNTAKTTIRKLMTALMKMP